MPRYKLTIAYDGTNFCGWQKQEPPATPSERPGSLAAHKGFKRHVDPTLPEKPGRLVLRTVQAVVENTICYVVREPVILIGSSRTDSGVHARGQVAAFSCSPWDDTVPGSPAQVPDPSLTPPPVPELRGAGWPTSRGADRLVRAINGRLPDDVIVTAAEVIHPNFDPINDCVSKGYSYLIHEAEPVIYNPDGSSITGFRPMFDRHYVHHVHDPLNVAHMQQAAAAIVGEHDFTSFAGARHGRLTTVRTVFTCTVTDVTDQFGRSMLMGARRIRIDISGSGFLFNMVRIIAGTLVEVGAGRIDPASIPAILKSLDRRRAGPTLPGTGLCLDWINYQR